METPTITIPETTTQARKPVIIGKFNGAFSPFQTSCFIDLKVAGFDATVAHKVAFDYGSDIGNAIRNAKDDALSSKIGKAKKDGDSRISLSGGGVCKTSPAMSIYRTVQQVEGLYKENLLQSRLVTREMLSKRLNEYLDNCDEWIAEQEFVQ